MADKKVPKISIGITSMTVVLCVLCLTVFSVLTLSTALTEQKFAEKRASAAQNYYAAETKAASLVNEMQDCMENGEDVTAFAEQNKITISGSRLSFYTPIDEGQRLQVELDIMNGLEITEWRVVSTADWTPDESLEVWDGEMDLEE